MPELTTESSGINPHKTRPWFPWNHGLPLRVVLIVPFVLQVCVAVGVTGWFSFRSGQQAVQDLAMRLQQQVRDRIIHHVQTYITTPALINHINAKNLINGQIDGNNLDQMMQQFIGLHEIFDGRYNINHISIGNANGTYLAVRRTYENEPFEVLRVSPTALGKLMTYHANASSRITHIEHLAVGYDPRQRPWYRKAMNLGKPGWSDIYNYFAESTVGVSHVYPIYRNGVLQSVLATDFDLGDISLFLQGLAIGKTGTAFIMERNGQFVASSVKENFFIVDQVNGQSVTHRREAIKSDSRQIRQVMEFLYGKFGTLKTIDQMYSAQVHGSEGTMFVQVTPLVAQGGIDWLLVVVIPKHDFMATLHQNAWLTLGFCLATLVVSSVVATLICQWISRGILRFSHAAAAIADGPPYDAAVEPPKINEFRRLALAFEQMRLQLQDSFTILEQTNHTLEQRVQDRTAELQRVNETLQRLATVDDLTQVPNRRRFSDYFRQEWQRALREHYEIAIILCDVDFFKAYNDTYGHQAGDICLQQVAWVLQEVIQRPTDLIARYGGEEFVIVLPHTNLLGAQQVAEEIRRSVEWLQIPHEKSPVYKCVTVSLGVCSVVPTASLVKAILIDTADKALYDAKAQGRNRVEARSLQ